MYMDTLLAIHGKDEIRQGLQRSFKDIKLLSQTFKEEDFYRKKDNKWSAAENLDHLIRSTKGLASALKLPKFVLRASLNLLENYKVLLQNGGVASGRYIPQKTDQFQIDKLLSSWTIIGDKFNMRLENWTEEQLDQYLLPHPLLGKLTVREMMFFTIFHNHHHYNAIQIAV